MTAIRQKLDEGRQLLYNDKDANYSLFIYKHHLGYYVMDFDEIGTVVRNIFIKKYDSFAAFYEEFIYIMQKYRLFH